VLAEPHNKSVGEATSAYVTFKVESLTIRFPSCVTASSDALATTGTDSSARAVRHFDPTFMDLLPSL
jgi:hypothetical protein